MANVKPRRGRGAVIAIVLLVIGVGVFLARGEYVARTRIVMVEAVSETQLRLSVDSCNGDPSVSEINQDVEDVVRIAVRSTQYIWGGWRLPRPADARPRRAAGGPAPRRRRDG